MAAMRGGPQCEYFIWRSPQPATILRKTCRVYVHCIVNIVSCTDITERVIFSLMGWNRPSGHVFGFYTECEFQYLKVRPFVMVSEIFHRDVLEIGFV